MKKRINCTRMILRKGCVAPRWNEEKDEFIVLVQNFLHCTELNNLFPPNSSDDLCLLSCINPSSMLQNLDNFLQYLERNLRAIMNILLWNLWNLLQSYLCSEEHENFPTASMKNLPIFLSCKKHDYFPTIRASRRNLPIYLSVINMNIFHQYLW